MGTSSSSVKSVASMAEDNQEQPETHTPSLMMKTKSSLTQLLTPTMSQARRRKAALTSLQELPAPTRRRSRRANPRSPREILTSAPQMVIFCESSEDKDASLEFDFSSFKQKRKMKTKLEF